MKYQPLRNQAYYLLSPSMKLTQIVPLSMHRDRSILRYLCIYLCLILVKLSAGFGQQGSFLALPSKYAPQMYEGSNQRIISHMFMVNSEGKKAYLFNWYFKGEKLWVWKTRTPVQVDLASMISDKIGFSRFSTLVNGGRLNWNSQTIEQVSLPTLFWGVFFIH